MPESRQPATAEQPYAVYEISALLSDYLARLGETWVEGQVAEVRETASLAYLKLRDIERDVTLSMYMPSTALRDVSPAIAQGSRIVVQAKVDWWPRKGTLQLKVLQVRTVGLGELMARLEALRGLLAAEGLFAPERKQRLPFLPRRIGLICGQNSDAMHDVIQNAQRRWPDAAFAVREVPVQGPSAARGVIEALSELDALDDVDVIIVTRGGGSFEDLLAFSDESLVRAVAAASTPVVAAIGHEEDRPLIDYVADYRASTPTDAARAVVPDVMSETAWLRNTRTVLRRNMELRLAALASELSSLRTKPALAAPARLVDQRMGEVAALRQRNLLAVRGALDTQQARLAGARSTLRALSPLGTLERGYAIVRDERGLVVRSTEAVAVGQMLRITVADGDVAATAN
jgi:exodeoxyribonuclease VII large subunit